MTDMAGASWTFDAAAEVETISSQAFVYPDAAAATAAHVALIVGSTPDNQEGISGLAESRHHQVNMRHFRHRLGSPRCPAVR